MAVIIFVVYSLIVFFVMSRDPVMKRDAQEFAKKVADNINNREKERIKQALQNSVHIRRRSE